MSRKITSAQAPFKILVANLTGGSDPSRGPSGNPVKARSTFTQQFFIDVPGREPDNCSLVSSIPGFGTRTGHVEYTVSPIPVSASGTLTVANNTFSGPTTIQLGEYILTTDEDFAVGVDATTTAANLAAAISLLGGYSATNLLAVVSISGPFGVLGNEVLFIAGGSSPANFTLNPNNERMTGAEPRIGPPIIT